MSGRRAEWFWTVLAVAAAAGTLRAEKVPLEEVPADIVEAVRKSHPAAEIRSVKKEAEDGTPVFAFQLLDGGKRKEVVYAATGKVYKIEEPVDLADLPAAVRDGLKEEFPDDPVRDIEKRTDAAGQAVYRVKTGAGKATFASDGRLTAGGNGSAEARLRKAFTGKGFEERNWETWLEGVAKAAPLNEERKAKAAELLGLAKEAAADYRKAKEAEYRRIAAQFAALRETPDPAKRAEAESAARELSGPVDAIGKRWKADVLGLLDDAGRKAVESRRDLRVAP